jgi:hypothetical protein
LVEPAVAAIAPAHWHESDQPKIPERSLGSKICRESLGEKTGHRLFAIELECPHKHTPAPFVRPKKTGEIKAAIARTARPAQVNTRVDQNVLTLQATDAFKDW